MELLSHVKWFVEGASDTSVGSLSVQEWLAVALGLAAGIALMFFVNKLFKPYDRKLDENLRRFREWVPTVVRLSTALLIIFNFLSDYFYAPDLVHRDNLPTTAINALLLLVAVMLIFGVYARTAGATLVVLYLLSFLVVTNAVSMFDHLEYLGIGAYLVLAGAGTMAVKQSGDPLDNLKSRATLAIPLLKTFVGLALIVLAFSEMLINMSLANEFLVHHDWNMLSSLGMSDRNFIIMAGIIEILIGLTLVLNRASRLGTLVLVSTMVLTAALLGIDEVFGHLFALSLVAAVWIGPNEDLLKQLRDA